MPRVSSRNRLDPRGFRHYASDDSMESKIGQRVTVQADGCWIMEAAWAEGSWHIATSTEPLSDRSHRITTSITSASTRAA